MSRGLFGHSRSLLAQGLIQSFLYEVLDVLVFKRSCLEVDDALSQKVLGFSLGDGLLLVAEDEVI